MLVWGEGGSGGAVGASVLIDLVSSVAYTSGELTPTFASPSVMPLEVGAPTFIPSSCSYPSPHYAPRSPSLQLSHSPKIPSSIRLLHPQSAVVILAAVVIVLFMVDAGSPIWRMGPSRVGCWEHCHRVCEQF
ncbi:uncharacterized protein ARMOST_19711 [Armillaria ostoyae]|uniref:Uncharacterized protein n=1 Tax=Armillaria ostoyae TaxID=47428 RepID=A0A284S5B0_ARMOS|nr:uncharacterized protein ARMOST_19711 [Armillaria ostoyae]